MRSGDMTSARLVLDEELAGVEDGAGSSGIAATVAVRVGSGVGEATAKVWLGTSAATGTT